jgi:hypothetical protein
MNNVLNVCMVTNMTSLRQTLSYKFQILQFMETQHLLFIA